MELQVRLLNARFQVYARDVVVEKKEEVRESFKEKLIQEG